MAKVKISRGTTVDSTIIIRTISHHIPEVFLSVPTIQITNIAGNII
jgi:hypothetical protein